MEDAAEELDVVVGCGDEVGVEEGEGDAVAGAVDDDVGVDKRRPSVKRTLPALHGGDVGHGRDGAVGDAVEDAPGDGGMGLAELVVGFGQA